MGLNRGNFGRLHAQGLQLVGILDQLLQDPAQIPGITQPEIEPNDPVPHQLLHPSLVGGDHRHAGDLGLLRSTTPWLG